MTPPTRFTVSGNAAEPAAIVDGDRDVACSVTWKFIVLATFVTPTVMLPAVAISAAGTVAARTCELITFVASVVDPKTIWLELLNPTPLTVMLKNALPATAELGEIEINWPLARTTNGSAFD